MTSVILKSTGVKLEKVKRKERPLVPDTLLRLVKMLESAMQPLPEHMEVAQDDLSEFFGDLICDICKATWSAHRPLSVCPICLYVTHADCLRQSILEPLRAQISLATASPIPKHAGKASASSSASSSSCLLPSNPPTAPDLVQLGLEEIPERLQDTTRFAWGVGAVAAWEGVCHSCSPLFLILYLALCFPVPLTLTMHRQAISAISCKFEKCKNICLIIMSAVTNVT